MTYAIMGSPIGGWQIYTASCEGALIDALLDRWQLRDARVIGTRQRLELRHAGGTIVIYKAEDDEDLALLDAAGW